LVFKQVDKGITKYQIGKKGRHSLKTEIARLSTLAITQTNIIIKYSLTGLYGKFVWQVTKKMSKRATPEQQILSLQFNNNNKPKT